MGIVATSSLKQVRLVNRATSSDIEAPERRGGLVTRETRRVRRPCRVDRTITELR
jgi:hypothetical protein